MPNRTPAVEKSKRRYDVDWIRTGALGLLIIYHVVISFQPWAKNIFFIQNDKLLERLWIPMSAVNVWRIPILFMVSGMGARFAFERRNWWQFLADRGLRIGIPLLFGSFVIVPFTYLFSLKFYEMDIVYKPDAGHLWFLINILSYVLYTIGILWTFKEYPDNVVLRFIAKWIRKPGIIFLFALLLMAEAVIMNPKYFSSYPTPHGHFLGAICFLLGLIFVSLKDEFFKAVQRVRWISLGLSFILYLIRLIVFEISLVPKFLVAFESMCWMLAVFGFASMYLNRPSKILAYFSKSVYPIYIIHFPVQFAISYYVISMEIPALLKLVILLVGTFGGCWLIYEFVIRRIKLIRPLFGMKWNQ